MTWGERRERADGRSLQLSRPGMQYAYERIHHPSGSSRGERGPRRVARAILAAMAVDIAGRSLLEVTELLGLSDHTGMSPRSIDRYVAPARALLTDVGGWSHADANPRRPSAGRGDDEHQR